MKALLLNSGIGKRMGSLVQDCPKCMVNIGNGHTIISWQLYLLKQCGVHNAVITTGPFAEKLRDYVQSLDTGMDIAFVENNEYASTNYIYSIECARALLDDDIILLHGDLVVEHSVLEQFVAATESCVAVDSQLPLPEKDFKAQLADGRVRAVGVQFFGRDCVACQPLYTIFNADMQIWLDEISRFCANGQRSVYAEEALNNITDSIALWPVELGGRLCHEIDNAHDLAAISARFINMLAAERSDG